MASIRWNRAPVKREGAERYVLLSSASFAVTVVLVRLLLELAGYPQIGNSELHIAHVLWGGLLLFLAALLPLTLVNRWAYTASAVLSGIGVGLFIDEVGKFVTQSNNYFYPPAASIIYGFFLLTVLLYLRVRRPLADDPRTQLYSIFDALGEVLDHDLDAQERAALEMRLEAVANDCQDCNQARLAEALLDFVHAEGLELVRPEPGRIAREIHHVKAIWFRLLNERLLKAVLVVGMGVLGIIALSEVGLLIMIALLPPSEFQRTIGELVTQGDLRSVNDVFWFQLRLGMEGSAGILSLAAAIFLLMGRDWRGVRLGVVSLLLSLTVVNLLVFYLDQFQAVYNTLFEFVLMLGAISYRRRFILRIQKGELGL